MGKKGFETAKVFRLGDSIGYAAGAVVSKTIIQASTGTVTLFAFDKGQGLSEHTAPFDALVQVIEGTGNIIIGGKAHELQAGDIIIMPGGVPHAVEAPESFKFLLTMIRVQP
jgi:quercetin dioxygenase-like cupin family protein